MLNPPYWHTTITTFGAWFSVVLIKMILVLAANKTKNISFHRIPAVHDREGKEDYKMKKR